MKAFTLATAALLGGIAAVPAFAQDTGVSSFTGPRVEFFGGYNHASPQFRSFGANPSSSRPRKHEGGIAGAQIGYDYQLGNFLVGAFGSYELPTSASCGTLSGINYGCIKPTGMAEGGARAGIVVRNFLVYAKGAYVNTRLNTTVLASGPTYLNSHINRSGYRGGAGAEYNLNQHFYVKAEYDYTQTKRINIAPYGFFNSDVRYKNHMGLVGAGIRF